MAARARARVPPPAWLGEFRFYVDKRAIIPRSFIAELLPDGLAPYVGDAAGVATALDMLR